MRTILNNWKKSSTEAVIPTSIAPQVVAQPVAPIALPAERVAKFRSFVANHLRAGVVKGKPETEIIGQLVAEQVAIAKALAEPHFVGQMAMGYAQELAQLQGNANLTEAKREVASILNNRILDLKAFVLMLGDMAFIEQVRAEAAQPAPLAKPYQLSAVKIEETIRRLVQPNDPDGPEPAVHVAASARGQQISHQALANLFRPSGALRAPLVHALAVAWPQASAGEIEHLAEGWLKARHDPAHSIANGMKPGGAIHDEAMRRAELLQQQKLAAAAQTVAVIEKAKASSAVAVNAPSTVTTAPREAQGVVTNLADITVPAL